ncbi:MAG: transcriptional repressor LexA [Chloroflexi bacterium]|nr:transcriptional repressor LexA [Chloroflexota bacterium]
MKKSRSEKQQRILDFIRTFLEKHDYPPSIRDIQSGCEISSTSVVDYNLKALEARGLIRRDREVSRAIQLVGTGGRGGGAVEVPVVGTIAAGEPLALPSQEGIDPRQVDETVTVTQEMIRGRDQVFALRVRGTSMIDALINDGDIVLMEPTDSVADGEMAAVYLGSSNETTFKRVYREGKRVRLQPENATMQPFHVDADDLSVQGRFVGVVRAL